MKDLIIETLEEVGIFIPIKEADFSLQEYIEDSFQFVVFIANLEEKLNMDFPIELINFEMLGSFNGFCNFIDELVIK